MREWLFHEEYPFILLPESGHGLSTGWRSIPLIISSLKAKPSAHLSQKLFLYAKGKFLPEAGVPTILKAAKLLEGSGIQFHIIGHGFLEKETRALAKKLNSYNVELITEFLHIDALRKKML